MLMRIREHLGRQDGVAAVEFAIVSMVFLVILFGILTYGFIFGLDQSLNHAAEEGARSAISAPDSPPLQQPALDKAKATALQRLGWLGSRIQDSDVVATLVDPCPNDAAVTCIQVTITYPWNTRPIIPKFPGLPTPDQMQAVAVIELT
jgi:hypothetical protein